MTPLESKLECQAIQRHSGKSTWWELSFVDESGAECSVPRIFIENLPLNGTTHIDNNSTNVFLSEYGKDEISIISMDPSVQRGSSSSKEGRRKQSSKKEGRRKQKQRGSFGRLADRIAGRRSDNDSPTKDDHTVTTSASSTSRDYDDPQSQKLDRLLPLPTPPPAPPPPMDILTRTADRSGTGRNPRSSGRNVLSSQKYIGLKEQTKRSQQSDERRSLVRSSLYTCIEDDEDDILANLLIRPTSQKCGP